MRYDAGTIGSLASAATETLPWRILTSTNGRSGSSTAEEAAHYEAYLRPRIKGGLGSSRGAVAALWAVKR